MLKLITLTFALLFSLTSFSKEHQSLSLLLKWSKKNVEVLLMKKKKKKCIPPIPIIGIVNKVLCKKESKRLTDYYKYLKSLKVKKEFDLETSLEEIYSKFIIPSVEHSYGSQAFWINTVLEFREHDLKLSLSSIRSKNKVFNSNISIPSAYMEKYYISLSPETKTPYDNITSNFELHPSAKSVEYAKNYLAKMNNNFITKHFSKAGDLGSRNEEYLFVKLFDVFRNEGHRVLIAGDILNNRVMNVFFCKTKAECLTLFLQDGPAKGRYSKSEIIEVYKKRYSDYIKNELKDESIRRNERLRSYRAGRRGRRGKDIATQGISKPKARDDEKVPEDLDESLDVQ